MADDDSLIERLIGELQTNPAAADLLIDAVQQGLPQSMRRDALPRRADLPRVLFDGADVTATADGTKVWAGPSRFSDFDFIGGSLNVKSKTDRSTVQINIGAGADCCFDLLVSSCFATLPGFVEGTAYESKSGCIFWGYSTYGAAVAKAATVFGATQSTVVILVCLGDYSGEATVTWPTVLFSDVGGGNHEPSILTVGIGAEMQYVGQNLPQALLPGISVPTPAANYLIPHLCFDGIGVGAGISSNQTTGISIQASRTQFFGRIQGNFANCSFSDCYLPVGASSLALLATVAQAADISITGCRIAGIIDFRNQQEADPYGSSIVITGNQFIGDNAAIYLGSADVIVISGNTFTTSSAGRGADTILYDPADSYTTGHMVISGNSFEEGPAAGLGLIRFNASTTTQGQVNSLAITGNSFGGAYSGAMAATTAYIKLTGSTLRRFRNVSVLGNTFGEPGNDTDWLVARGGFTVIGTFVERSVFGPNAPAGQVSYNITNGANNEFYPPSSASGTSTSIAGEHHTAVGIVDTTVVSTTVPYVVVGPFANAATITGVEAVAGSNVTAGATSAIYDVHKILAANANTDGQGTTIFTVQADRPTISNGNKKSTTTLPAITAVAAGDYLAFYVDQQGTSLLDVTIAVRMTMP